MTYKTVDGVSGALRAMKVCTPLQGDALDDVVSDAALCHAVRGRAVWQAAVFMARGC
jgi:hypothetical protein